MSYPPNSTASPTSIITTAAVPRGTIHETGPEVGRRQVPLRMPGPLASERIGNGGEEREMLRRANKEIC